MALNTQLSNTAASLAADAICGSAANNGYLRIYDGSQPANANTVVSTQNLLCEITLPADVFDAAVNGVASLAATISGSVIYAGTNTAAWFRVLESNGSTVLWDGTIGTATANMVLDSTSLSYGATVQITGWTFTVREATTGY